MIEIQLNGKREKVQSGLTVLDLLLKWKARPELLTVEVNGSILQKLDYESRVIQQEDNVNFVFYMGGAR